MTDVAELIHGTDLRALQHWLEETGTLDIAERGAVGENEHEASIVRLLDIDALQFA